VTPADWAGFALAIFLIELTPGPNMAWLAALALGQGRRAGLAACAGIALGLLVNALVAGFGVAAFIIANPDWWQVLRWGGVAFMLWLAWEAWRDSADTAVPDDAALARPARRHFLSGLVVNLLNPKALIFFAVLIPQYMGPATPAAALVVAVSLVSVTIATLVHVAIVLAGSGLTRWLADSGRSRPVRRGLALSLVGVALWFAFGAAPPA
jgi:threonine/homoserine/homoserine lactone efflux protein